jgi:hypothetical protein
MENNYEVMRKENLRMKLQLAKAQELLEGWVLTQKEKVMVVRVNKHSHQEATRALANEERSANNLKH